MIWWSWCLWWWWWWWRWWWYDDGALWRWGGSVADKRDGSTPTCRKDTGCISPRWWWSSWLSWSCFCWTIICHTIIIWCQGWCHITIMTMRRLRRTIIWSWCGGYGLGINVIATYSLLNCWFGNSLYLWNCEASSQLAQLSWSSKDWQHEMRGNWND